MRQGAREPLEKGMRGSLMVATRFRGRGKAAALESRRPKGVLEGLGALAAVPPAAGSWFSSPLRPGEVSSLLEWPAGHFQELLSSFAGLLCLFVALIAWELLAGRSAPAAPRIHTSLGGEGEEEGPGRAQEEEDPFRSLLKEASRTAAPATGGGEPARLPPLGSRGEVPSALSGPGSAAPGRRTAGEEENPFMRLSQIGAEEASSAAGGPGAGAAPSDGGDWAELLRRVQGGDSAQTRATPAAAAKEEAKSPMSSPGPPSTEADPWQSLLRKAAGESESPSPPRLSPGGALPSPPGVAGPPSTEDEGSPGVTRKAPRVIPLDLKSAPQPPPVTEEE